jgi:hypothetical protein
MVDHEKTVLYCGLAALAGAAFFAGGALAVTPTSLGRVKALFK